MQFYRIATFIIFALTLGLLASSTPVTDSTQLDKRQSSGNLEADIISILTTLNTTVSGVLPAFANVTDNSTAAPVFSAITVALDTATAALAALNDSSSSSCSSMMKRQTENDVASLAASIVSSIVTAANPLTSNAAAISGLADFESSLDQSLNQLLRGLEGLLAGLLNLVAQLLTDVAQLLRNLALSLTAASLGF